MKKINFTMLTLLMVLLFSCSKNDIVESDSNGENQKEYIITKKQAVSVAESLLSLDDKSYARSKVSNSLIDVKTYKTKSDRPVFYTVRKNDNFYVISADKRLQLVQAYVTDASGKLPLNLEYFLKSNVSAIESFIDSDFNSFDKQEIKSNIDFVDQALIEKEEFEGLKNIANSVSNDLVFAKDEGPIDEPKLDGYWVKYGPLLKEKGLTKWNQNSEILTERYKDDRPKTYLGCTTTAVCQVLKFHEKSIESIFDFKDYPFKGEADQTNYDDILSQFSEKITTQTDDDGQRWSSLGYSPISANSVINSYVKGVKSKYYLGGFAELKNILAINSLKEGLPIIGAGDGHAWVLEGYIKTRIRKGFGNSFYSRDKYGDFYYMNWGWNGRYNGWYKLYHNYSPNKKYSFGIQQMLTIIPN